MLIVGININGEIQMIGTFGSGWLVLVGLDNKIGNAAKIFSDTIRVMFLRASNSWIIDEMVSGDTT